MAERRRYTKREKADAVVAAATGPSLLAAAESKGIPESTLRSWMMKPEYANLRDKTREEIAEDSLSLAYLAQAELARKVSAGEVEPRDLAVIYGIAIDKAQLLAGHATARTESRDLTSNDHESEVLRDVIAEELARRGERGQAADGAAEAAVADPAPAESGTA